MSQHSKSEAGQTIVEFSIVMVSLTFLFAGAFTTGAMLNKALQVSNVTRSAAVLMVRSVTNPSSNLNLADTVNQRILIREASGLGMASDSSYDPSSTGNGAIFLSQIVLVGANECATGVTPTPSGAPPWNAGNCPNYGSYAYEYYVPIGNTTRWASAFGAPPTADIQSDGTISDRNIAMDTANRVTTATMTNVITLSASQFVLISETYADISSVSVFSIFKPPVVYYRTLT
jgi:hypothetical protein